MSVARLCVNRNSKKFQMDLDEFFLADSLRYWVKSGANLTPLRTVPCMIIFLTYSYGIS